MVENIVIQGVYEYKTTDLIKFDFDFIESLERVFEKSLMMYQIFSDPPKSPLKKGTLTLVPPLLRGVRGDL
ncbi:MAG: hypothetical protein ACKO11_14390 [Cuspidothrix sp.]